MRLLNIFKFFNKRKIEISFMDENYHSIQVNKKSFVGKTCHRTASEASNSNYGCARIQITQLYLLPFLLDSEFADCGFRTDGWNGYIVTLQSGMLKKNGTE